MGKNLVKLSRDEKQQNEPVPVPRKVAKSGRQRTAEWRERVRRKEQRMKRIAEKAEQVTRLLFLLREGEVVLPGSLFTPDAEKTLENIGDHLWFKVQSAKQRDNEGRSRSEA